MAMAMHGIVQLLQRILAKDLTLKRSLGHKIACGVGLNQRLFHRRCLFKAGDQLDLDGQFHGQQIITNVLVVKRFAIGEAKALSA
jgi:hypothetical protein